jgi:hypothetical protein
MLSGGRQQCAIAALTALGDLSATNPVFLFPSSWTSPHSQGLATLERPRGGVQMQKAPFHFVVVDLVDFTLPTVLATEGQSARWIVNYKGKSY